MSKNIFIFFVLSIISIASFAKEDPVAVFSYQDTSCGAWTLSALNEPIRAQYFSWFRGFISGYNFGNSTNQVSLEKMPDNQTLSLFIDKFCRERPLNPFTVSAFDLVRELRINNDKELNRSNLKNK